MAEQGRSRHGPATVSGEPRPIPRGSHWAPRGAWEGRATAPIHESGDLAAIAERQPLSRQKEWSMRHASRCGLLVLVPVGAAGGGGRRSTKTRGSGGGDGDQGRDPVGAARGLRQRGERGGLPDLSLPDRGRGAPQRPGRRDPALRRLRQDLEHQHPRRQRQPGAGPGGRRAGEEPDARAGGPLRHLPGPDRAHRGHPGRPVHALRRRRHRRRGQHHHPQGHGRALPGHRRSRRSATTTPCVSRATVERGVEDPELRAVGLALREQRPVPERRDRRQRGQRAHRGHAALEHARSTSSSATTRTTPACR